MRIIQSEFEKYTYLMHIHRNMGCTENQKQGHYYALIMLVMSGVKLHVIAVQWSD